MRRGTDTQRPTRLMRNVIKRRQFKVKWKRVRNRKLLFHLRFANMFLSLMNILLVLFRNGLCLFFSHVNHASELIMAALWNKAGHYILALWFLLLSSFFLFSSPNLSRRRLDVNHTSTHGVALVRI